MNQDVRPSPIAGRWYEGDPDKLARQVDTFLAQAQPPQIPGQVVALVVPHAGHRYSGRTAAHAFKCVQGSAPDLVAVVSPMHSPTFRPILSSAHSAYQTPLGQVPVDQASVSELDRALREAGLPGATPVANDSEHSLEIELPFLQRALSSPFKLLPVMVHTLDIQILQALGNALAGVLAGKNALLVASTDLSHFYTLAQANELDAEMLRQMEAFSPESVLAAEENGTGFACGAGPVAAVFWAARRLGAGAVKILHYSTSAEETGDRNSVVGYGAAAVYKTG